MEETEKEYQGEEWRGERHRMGKSRRKNEEERMERR